MKSIPFLLGCLLSTAIPGVFAAMPSTNASPVPPAPIAAQDQKPVIPVKPSPGDAKTKSTTMTTNGAPVSFSAAEPAELKFDDYLKDLGDTLKLTDEEKKSIQADYMADGIPLKNILNNDSLSPLQKAQQVSDLRDARNTKIEALLGGVERQRAFLHTEARYRVALTELAADGNLVPAPPPSPAPAPTTNNPPGQVEKTPMAQGAGAAAAK